MKRLIIIVFFCSLVFGTQVIPVMVMQDGVQTDAIFFQEFVGVEWFDFGIGISTKRIGIGCNYTTPYLIRSIIIHFGVYERFEDMPTFTPAFVLGAAKNGELWRMA